MSKPIFKRYYAAYNNGWSFVVSNPGEWVWAYFHARGHRPDFICRSLGDLIAWVRR